ncbi:MAG: hypothetical protein J6T92_03315, partial [Ottowia sp.]|nr:hypothetical protein [Ottowia sp.]
EEQGLVIFPYEVELALGGLGELGGLTALGRDEVYLGVALVLVHIVVRDGVGDLLAVGGDGFLSHLAQCPHYLRGETALLHLDIGFPDDVHTVGVLFLRAAANQEQRSKCDKYLFHIQVFILPLKLLPLVT